MAKILVVIFMAVLLTGCKIGGGGGGGASSGSASGMMASIQSDGGISHQSDQLDTEAPVSDTEAPVLPIASVNPEPSTIVIFSLGLAVLAAKALRRKKI